LDAPSAGKFPVVDRPRRFFQTMPRFVRHDRAAGKGRRARSKVERGFRTLKGPELREITSHTIATPADLPSPPLAGQIANPLYTPTASATSTTRQNTPPASRTATAPTPATCPPRPSSAGGRSSGRDDPMHQRPDPKIQTVEYLILTVSSRQGTLHLSCRTSWG